MIREAKRFSSKLGRAEMVSLHLLQTITPFIFSSIFQFDASFLN